MVKKRNIKKTVAARIKRKRKVQRRKPVQRIESQRKKRKLKKERQPSVIALIKSEENPIIAPKPENEWEAWQTFNPGVILLGGKVHFLYRAIGKDGISRLGYAVSHDGFTIDERLSFPAYQEQLKKL